MHLKGGEEAVSHTSASRMSEFPAELSPRMPTWKMGRTKGSSDARHMPLDSP